MSRIATIFEALKARREKALIAYIMAGDPSLHRTADLVMELERAGADIIELGVPFSDPIADGPVIQKAGQRALKGGTTLRGILDLVSGLRAQTQIPLVAMSYYNPILKYGVSRFFAKAARAGLDGVIIPDLPPEEGEVVASESRRRGVDWILLAAPTSPPVRQRKLARETRGFLYYVSITGITGAALRDFGDIHKKVSAIRKAARSPVAIGFGVSTPENARKLGRFADGVIVGSAIVRLIEEHAEKSDLPSIVGDFARNMKKALIRPSQA